MTDWTDWTDWPDELPDEYYEDKFERQRHAREMRGEPNDPQFEEDDE